ncbi:hypothetical protein DTL42_13415 [Bremerella cremea]|uniref:Carboxypeptidase regulatory-like domain-containing protein n=1 Tax=Bremerella cremea TaxID=1031537 RepID=A0A368KQH6_9BACT|nr:hypothetical protein [Bremerella cremea]RCS48318.1 hypothetical protein DTL42_13415 [Bremerella cremea]
MTRLPFAASLLALGLLSFTVGCGAEKSDTVTVKGNVTVDGEPLEKGSITFLAADGATPASGGTIEEGKYTAEIIPGEKKVMVLGTKVVGQELVLEGVPDSGTRDKIKTITHANYNAMELTPLKASITGSAEGVDFALTKDGK